MDCSSIRKLVKLSLTLLIVWADLFVSYKCPFSHFRINASVGNKTEPLVQQKSGQSDDGSHLCTIRCSSLDHGCGSPPVAESPNGISHNGWSQSIAETEGFVNNFNDQDNLTEHLNDSESPMLEAQLEHIDNWKNVKSRIFSDEN